MEYVFGMSTFWTISGPYLDIHWTMFHLALHQVLLMLRHCQVLNDHHLKYMCLGFLVFGLIEAMFGTSGYHVWLSFIQNIGPP